MAKHQSPRGMFDEHFRLEKLSKQKDPLERLNDCIKWEQFRSILDDVFKKENRGIGGRPAYNYLMMFKILILQRYYNLSDDQTEYQILDRLSFMRFLGLGLGDRVPDSKTIWLFKETLIKNKTTELLFSCFAESLAKAGLVANEGKIVDASFVEVPRQRNTREENQQIKDGETPEQWEDFQSKLSQKDLDARWTKKNNVTFYGYKNHIKVDEKSKLIDRYTVTSASVHDSQPVQDIVGEEDRGQELYGDSAYTGPAVGEYLISKGITPKIIEKGYKNNPLTKEQNKKNRAKSAIRCRIEHIFGFIEVSMKRSYIRCIGILRANTMIGLMNLTYNLFRSVQLLKIQGSSLSV
jgi:IS5 family transposase